ncbi:MAG: glycogen/starch/alpha-glucan family phosphorylase [Clostridia bacterium]|nr:glycogen/starch/alpha-glucan family phosphorylase [Clostridia bacterium]
MEEIFKKSLEAQLEKLSNKSQKNLDKKLVRAVCAALLEVFCTIPARKADTPRAAYFSAEFLTGSFVTGSLATLNLWGICEQVLKQKGYNIEALEKPRDPALGNGGLGRLAACLLDSAAATDIPLDGYGIRYRYGIFRQDIKNCEQTEQIDIWQDNCPLEKQRRDEAVLVQFGDTDVLAVPYDVPIVGKNQINRLRLWSAEATSPVDFTAFSEGNICSAFSKMMDAEAISGFLYPPDNTEAGKELRLKQQYFFSSASVQSILRDFKKTARPIGELSDYIKIQLNDTHPTVAIPELLRLLCEDFGRDFETALKICGEIFSYTNHTVMAEALECWNEALFCRVVPKVYPYVVMLNNHLMQRLKGNKNLSRISIIENGVIRMANMAVYVSHKINGVAKIHSEIIKESIFKDFYELYPERFLNITNGIAHRRWLCLANRGLTHFANSRLGTDWQENLPLLEQIKQFNSTADLDELAKIKAENKKALAKYLKNNFELSLDPDYMFSVQIKRIHEYKRQLLNILSVLGLYIDLKNGELKDFYPTAFIFAGKAASGYYNAKQIIKLINAVSRLIEKDETAKKYFKVLFIPDYNVKNAMKIIPAADLSEQLSTAGTEASGTGNMKLSLNGAPTIGTLDGANIEIVDYAGEENNYIFGAKKEELACLTNYDPMNIYYSSDRISRVVDLLKQGPAGDFTALFNSLLFGDDADRYKVLLDYPSYQNARLRANEDYKNSRLYAEKSLINIAAASHFSADQTVGNYNKKIWKLM